METRMHGMKVDAEKIGAGLYSILCDKGEDHIVAFGMIPSWIMDALHKMLREKVMSEAAIQVGCTEQELTLMGVIDNKKVDSIVRDIEHKVCVAIYAAASKAGKMVA